MRELLAGLVFAFTFVALALGGIGRVPLARGTAALAGGLATAALLGVSWRAIDLQVMALLAGLMVLAGLAEAAGLFAGLRRRLLPLDPALALWVSLAVMAATSAVLLNDAAVVVLVPFLLPVLRAHGLDLVRSVTLLTVAANVGSLLTPFGNPQNAVLASAAGLTMRDFIVVHGPVAAMGLGVLGVAAVWTARRRAAPGSAIVPVATARGRALVILAVLGFLALAAVRPRGLGLGTAALLAGGLAYLLMRARIGREADAAAWRGLDWNVLALFAGLYLLTGGLREWFPAALVPTAFMGDAVGAVLGTALLSNAVGNVPAVLTLLRLDPAWTLDHAQFLVSVSTLGGRSCSPDRPQACSQRTRPGRPVSSWGSCRSCALPCLGRSPSCCLARTARGRSGCLRPRWPGDFSGFVARTVTFLRKRARNRGVRTGRPPRGAKKDYIVPG